MKHIRCFLVPLFLVLILNNTFMTAFAMNTGFSTEPMSKEEAMHFLQSTNISVLKNEPKEETIEYFDVNENGLIALVFFGIVEKTIGVYTSDGIFQYGYKFNSYGSVAVEWDGDNLNLCYVRSDVVVSVNPQGEIEGIREIQNTFENNSHWTKSVFSNEKTVGGTEYELKNDMGILNAMSMNYSQLVATKTNGDVIIIYDANAKHLIRTLILNVAVIFVVCLIVVILTRLFIRTRSEYLMSRNNEAYNNNITWYNSSSTEYENGNIWDNNGNKGNKNGNEWDNNGNI